MAPFAKDPVELTLNGITNDDTDLSVDLIRTVTLMNLKKFGIDNMELKVAFLESANLKVKKRGAPPLGGGQAIFTSQAVKELQPLNLMDEGKIRRIRGIAYD